MVTGGRLFWLFWCAVVLTVFFMFLISKQLELPDQNELRRVSVQLASAPVRGLSEGFSVDLIGWKHPIYYAQRCGNATEVRAALDRAYRNRAAVLIEHGTLGREKGFGEVYRIYSVSTAGYERSYRACQIHWVANNRLVVWALLPFVLYAFYVLYSLIRYWRRGGEAA